jgi:RHS repeat-associated protein
MTQVTDTGNVLGEYVYNGNGQRVKKYTENGTKCTVFHYDKNGMLIAESSSSGTVKAEYIYLNGQPLAMIENNNIYYYHNDHLGTSMVMSDESQNIVWQGEYLPFGESYSVTGSVSNNIRFPGQYYDSETELHYNYYRDYNALIGRYVEADPLLLPFNSRSLNSGCNMKTITWRVPVLIDNPEDLYLYVHVKNNPINYTDLFGLKCVYPSGFNYVGLLHRVIPSLRNIFSFDLPCGANKKADHIRVDKSEAIAKAGPLAKKFLNRKYAATKYRTKAKCNETGSALVQVETRLSIQPGAISYLLNNLKVCYECKCCKK